MLVLIAVGVIHLSGSGTAVPLQGEEIASGASTSQQTDGGPEAEASADPGTDATDTEAAPEGSAAGVAGGSGSGAQAGGAAASADPPGSDESGGVAGGNDLVVHVSGAVQSPGVVHLPPGSRVEDAPRAAGGTTEEADLAAINLARPVADGEQIQVPVPGEELPAATAAGGDGGGVPAADGGEGEAAGGGTIDLNTASAAELEELPGVGPSIAQRILEHREKNGPFTSVDGLLEVSGIGPATLEKIRDRARV